MQLAYSEPSPKLKRKPTNVSVRVDLLQIAREDNINLSGMLEGCLVEYGKKRAEKEWLERNRKAISDINDFVEEYGLLSDDRRLF
jgi:antitoxin CcdA